MITKLSIQHYRSIENLDLELGPVTLFVGQNGAGKSNIIDAIKFVRDSLRNGLDWAVAERHGIQNIRQWSPTRPYHVSIGLHARGGEGRWEANGKFSFTLSSSGDSYKIHKEEAEWNDIVTTRFRAHRTIDIKPVNNFKYSRDKGGCIKTNWLKDSLTLESGEMEEFFISSPLSHPMRSWLFSDFECYVIFPNTLRDAQKLSREPHLTSHGENIASVLKMLRRKRKAAAIQEIVGTMKKIVPNLENITARAVGSFIVPRFYIRPNQEKGHYFDVDQMSDGTLRLLGILVALYQDPGPSVIALEEPELTVHPGALPLIADAIKEVSETRQVLVTTHSPDLLDQFEPDQIVAVEYEDGATRAHPLNTTQKKAARDKLFTLGRMMSFEGLHG